MVVEAEKVVNSKKRGNGKLKELEAEVKRLKLELERRDKYIRELIRQIPAPAFFLVLDEEGRIKYVNEYVAKIYGGDVEDLIGRKPSEIAKNKAAEGSTLVELAFEKKLKIEGKEGFLEVENGVSMPILTSCAPIFIDDEFSGMVDFFIDISKMKEKERLVEELFEKIPVATLYIDKDHKVVYWNRTAEDLTGVKSVDVIGTNRHWYAFYDEERPILADLVLDNPEDAEKYYSIIKRSDITKGAYVVETWVNLRNGRKIYARATAAPVYDADGNIIGAIETIEDLTKSKMAEEETQKILDFIQNLFVNIPHPTYIVYADTDYKFRYANKEVAKLTGVDSVNEVIGKEPSELFVTDGRKTMLEKTIDSGKPILDKEVIVKTISGVEMPALMSCVPIHNKDGKMVGAIDVFIDITPIKEKEKQIRETLEYTKRSLNKIGNAILELQSGKLNVRIEKEKDDDFGKIFDAFNDFVEILQEIVNNIVGDMNVTVENIKEAVEAVNQMNAGMQQISSASQQIATGSENLSRIANNSAVELKSAEEIFKELASSAKDSSNYANNAVKTAEITKEMGSNALKRLEAIIQEISKSAEIVDSLNQAVRKIGKVTEKIKSIADQTNLLALNAAIEAARAGEHGRGFAVVADEVRKLAEESRKSTEEINEIVASVQEETKKVIENIKKSKEESEEGSKGIEEALNKAEEIAEHVMAINSMLENVLKGAQEGVEKIESIARNFEEVASTAEENAASSEETSAAIEEQTAAIQQVSASMDKINSIANETLGTVKSIFKL